MSSPPGLLLLSPDTAVIRGDSLTEDMCTKANEPGPSIPASPSHWLQRCRRDGRARARGRSVLCWEAGGVVRLACVPEGLTAAAGCRPTLPGPLRAAPRRPLQVPGTAQAVSFSEDHVTVRRAACGEEGNVIPCRQRHCAAARPASSTVTARPPPLLQRPAGRGRAGVPTSTGEEKVPALRASARGHGLAERRPCPWSPSGPSLRRALNPCSLIGLKSTVLIGRNGAAVIAQ